MDLNELRSGAVQRISSLETLPAKQTALIIVDMIKRFCDSAWCARGDADRQAWIAGQLQAVTRNIRRMLDAFRKERALVVHVVHGKWTVEDREVPGYSRGREYDLFGTADMSVIDELAPIPGEMVVPKVAGSSFIGTGLEYFLRNAGIENLVLCGQQGDACVLYTTIGGRDLGFSNYWAQDSIYFSSPLYQELYSWLVPKRWAKLATAAEVTSAIAVRRAAE